MFQLLRNGLFSCTVIKNKFLVISISFCFTVCITFLSVQTLPYAHQSETWWSPVWGRRGKPCWASAPLGSASWWSPAESCGNPWPGSRLLLVSPVGTTHYQGGMCSDRNNPVIFYLSTEHHYNLHHTIQCWKQTIWLPQHLMKRGEKKQLCFNCAKQRKLTSLERLMVKQKWSDELLIEWEKHPQHLHCWKTSVCLSWGHWHRLITCQ